MAADTPNRLTIDVSSNKADVETFIGKMDNGSTSAMAVPGTDHMVLSGSDVGRDNHGHCEACTLTGHRAGCSQQCTTGTGASRPWRSTRSGQTSPMHFGNGTITDHDAQSGGPSQLSLVSPAAPPATGLAVQPEVADGQVTERGITDITELHKPTVERHSHVGDPSWSAVRHGKIKKLATSRQRDRDSALPVAFRRHFATAGSSPTS